MKKMSKETGNVRFQAFSSTDGITINSVRELGPLSFLSSMAVKATLNQNGKIDCKEVQFHVQHTLDDVTLVKESRIITLVNRFTGLILMVIYMVLFLRSGTRAAELVSSLWFLNYSFQFIDYPVVMSFKRILGNKNAQSLARFHAAEHAVINAYYDLQRVPTLDEIHEYSSYSYRCGSLNGFKYGILFLGFALARLIPGLGFIIAIPVAWLIHFILVKTNRLTFMEFLVLDKPTDTEYAVAIKAMEESVKNIDLNLYFPDMESVLELAKVIESIIGENVLNDENLDDFLEYDNCQAKKQDD